MLANILLVTGGSLAGLIAALSIIAPRVHNKIVDRVLADARLAAKILEAVEGNITTQPNVTPDVTGAVTAGKV